MRSNNWLKQRREEVGISTQDELATRLQLDGFNVTRAAVSHWENGRNPPPMDDSHFRKSLAKILRLSEPDLLQRAGYPTFRTHRSEVAERGADIIDQLPPEKQELALKLLEQLL